MTDEQIDAERTAFERAWMSLYAPPGGMPRSKGLSSDGPIGQYILNHTQVAWEVWLEGAKERAGSG